MENQDKEKQGSGINHQGFSEVYVMPEKFRPQSSGGGNFGIIISASILLAVMLLTGGFFIYDSWQKRQVSQQPPVDNLPQIEIQEEEVFSTTTATTTEEVATSTATSTETIVATSTASTTSETAISLSRDSDNDGLTDVEETVFGTVPANPDSDGDGYKDGNEVVNGYSPTKPGNVKIGESPFISSITTDFGTNDFKATYPKDWRPSVSKSAHQLLLSVNTGEVITVTVKENREKIPAMSWYLQDHPQVPVSQLRLVDSGDLSGIYSPDGMAAYLTDKDKSNFYVFEYVAGRQSEFRYPAIFAMLIKQIKIIANSVVTAPKPAASNAGTAAACSKYFCASQACGILPDGTNSCETNPPQGTCYEKTCESDLDCSDDMTCQEVSCYSGDAGIISMVCKK